ncbi:hypothetical protein ACFL4O_00970 [bacterium]
MMPNSSYNNFYNENSFIISDNILENGFGYWLVWHRQILSKEQEKDYENYILRIFNNMDIMFDIKKYNITAIQAVSSINSSIKIREIKEMDDSNIYLIGENI